MINLIKFFLAFPAFLYNKLNFKLRNIQVGKNIKIEGYLMTRGRGSIVIGDNVSINSSLRSNPVGLSTQVVFSVYKGAKLTIGDNCGISNSLICSRISVTLDENVLIGGGCQILDNDFHSLNFEHRIKSVDPDIKRAAIHIKEGAFIGTNSIILKGVTIGKRSIVGAGSVVSKSIPDGEIWAGNPAKLIKKISL